MNELQVKHESQDASTPIMAAVSPETASKLPQSRSATGLARSSLIPYARYGAQKLGHAGIIGLSLLIFSIVSFFSTNAPMRDEVSSRAADLENARALAGQQQHSGTRAAGSGPAAQIVSHLPSRNDLPQIMGQIVTVATASGLALDRGSYEFTPTESGEVSRYRLTLPVRGNYPQVRQFIENTLAAVPAAALEGMRIERSEVSNQVIAADLQFAVLVGSKQ
jgi:hypothetical protein